jgi:hypothetical protein
LPKIVHFEGCERATVGTRLHLENCTIEHDAFENAQVLARKHNMFLKANTYALDPEEGARV